LISLFRLLFSFVFFFFQEKNDFLFFSFFSILLFLFFSTTLMRLFFLKIKELMGGLQKKKSGLAQGGRKTKS